MIDLSNYKEGDNLGTIYEVYVFGDCDEIATEKHEGCVLTTLEVGKYITNYCVEDNLGKTVCSWYGSAPHWGTKVDEVYFSLDDACNAYKKILEGRIGKLSKEIAEYKKIVLYGLKDAFK